MRAEDRRSVVQDAALSAVALLLVLVAMAALAPLVSGSGWWWAGAATAAGAIGAGFGLRAARVPAGFVPPAEILVATGILTLAFGRDAVLGVVPTAATFEGFGELVSSAAVAIREQAAPVAADVGLRFLLAIGAAIVAIAVDIVVVALRAPAFAAIPVAVPMAIPLIILGEAELLLAVFVAAVYLLLLWVDVRVRRSAAPPPDAAAPRVVSRPPRIAPAVGSALALAGVGILSATLLAVSLPMTGGGVGPGSIGVGAGVSPFVDLAADLRRPAARPVLHYTTSDDSRPYFTLMTLDRFEGTVWTSAAGGIDSSRDVGAIDEPVGLSGDVARSEVGVRVWVDRLDSPWLPVPKPTSRITGLEGEWHWDEATRAVRSASASADGQSYRTDTLELAPTAEQLRAASLTAPPGEFDVYRELPEELPPALTDTVAEVTAGSASPYDAATKLQAYLRGPSFTYSLDTPVQAGYDGGSLELIAEFLEVKSGYCVHFASTMAVMARSLGIPARIALGYMPGESDGRLIGGKVRRNIDSHDLHTWPELYFEGVGWVPFEPTPGRGVVPGYSRVAPAASSEGRPEPTAAPTTAPAVVPTGSATPTPSSALAGSDGVAGGGASFDAGPAALVIALLALLALPALARAWIGAFRRRRIRAGGADAARAAWSELRDRVLDLGGEWDETMTARTFAAGLRAAPWLVPRADGTGVEVARAAIERLVGAYERAEYAPASAGTAVTTDDLAAALAPLGAALPWYRRMLAAAAPRSLARLVRERTLLRTPRGA